MEILPLDIKSERNLPSFLANSLDNPFATYGVQKDLYIKYVLSDLSDTVSKGGFILAAKENNDVIGLVSLKRSDWDSQHFAIAISKIDQLLSTGNYLESTNIKRRLIAGLLAKCSKDLLLHVSIRVNKEELSSIHALESKFFRLMDILVTYSIDLRKHKIINSPNPYDIRKFRPDEIPKLAQMAFECFENTALATDRFHADSLFPKAKSSEVYSKWLINSVMTP